ncbi:MAG: hypothetical protein PHD82_02630 [Candidatus Riflebacteria bacterium]|nr:hypothetical protein [Candidatus Riflebacteria bacterium]
MKKLTIVLVVTMLLGVGVVMAQSSSSSDVAQQSQVVLKADIATSDNTSTVAQSKPATCPGDGRGYGDGTRKKPRDGTGFGAKADKRQYRNAAEDKGQGKGLKNGQGKQNRKMLRNGQGAQNGNGQRLRKRDGSCGLTGNSSSVTVPAVPSSKP